MKTWILAVICLLAMAGCFMALPDAIDYEVKRMERSSR